MRTIPLLSIVLSLVVLTACGSAPLPPPSIKFVGIAEGTLQSDVQSLKFSDIFQQKTRSLVGAVSLSGPMDGATVVGTWFSPDDRSMPLGRTNILLQSGATLARFSFANTKDWEAAPYMLDVRLQAPDRKKITQEVASGSVHFFIGMKKEQIRDYAKEYLASKERERTQAVERQAKEKEDQGMLNRARELLRAPSATLAVNKDFNNDTKPESLFIDTHDLPSNPPAPNSLLFSGTVHTFALMDGSGSSLVSFMKNSRRWELKMDDRLIAALPMSPVGLVILQSSIISLSWNFHEKACSLDLLPEHGRWVLRAAEDSSVCGVIRFASVGS